MTIGTEGIAIDQHPPGKAEAAPERVPAAEHQLPDSNAADTTQFHEWVRPHLAVLGALSRRQVGSTDAPDLVQDTLLRAWRKRSSFRPERGTARAWLVAIMLDLARRRRKRAKLTVPLDDHDPADQAATAPTDPDLDNAIAALPDRQRQVVNLYYLADLPVAEIAGILRIAPGTVKSQLSDARASLRRTLGAQP